jgi:hypothetical protein
MGTIPIPCISHGLLCIPRCTLRRILCLWVQARVQHQGLWTEHPRTRWHDGPNGLPVRISLRSRQD